MRQQRALPWVLAAEIGGFLFVILLIWLDEYLDLPHILLHAARSPIRPEECWLESTAVVLLGALVVAASVRAFHRIRELETLLTICAWCKRIRTDGEWVSIETYVNRRDNLHTTHGMCPACYQETANAPAQMPGPR
ncbi:MAG TPA: hypothetical protein VFW66_01240 [Gemmatimonadales bacterium]|nr:hypothetical protein [Gemmatimonadales bacterium]